MTVLAVLLADLGTALMFAFLALMVAAVILGLLGRWEHLHTFDAAISLVLGSGLMSFAVSNLLAGDWVGALVSTVLAVVVLWDWWNRRRKRKDRAPLALGAKIKAIIDGMVRKVREAGKPRLVLRPVPGGAR